MNCQKTWMNGRIFEMNRRSWRAFYDKFGYL